MPEMTMQKPRPKYLNLFQIRLPLAGFVSILHRVSGALLFLLLPLVLDLFDASVGSRESFDAFVALVSNPFVKLILLGLVWAYLHHLCAGIRFLLIDADVGVDKSASRKSAMAVLAISLPLTLLLGVALLW